jgi:hypothetical protein
MNVVDQTFSGVRDRVSDDIFGRSRARKWLQRCPRWCSLCPGMLQLSDAGSGYAVSATKSRAVQSLASLGGHHVPTLHRHRCLAGVKMGHVTALPRPNREGLHDGGSSWEVSFVLEWETEGAVACDWNEDGEEVTGTRMVRR